MRKGLHWLAIAMNATLLTLMLAMGANAFEKTPVLDMAVGALLMIVTPVSLAALWLSRPSRAD
jgi:hypothetical protein